MNILDLHELRDGIFGSSKRLGRSFNPFIHVNEDAPLIRALYTITRPAFQREAKVVAHEHHSYRPKLIHATGGRAPEPPIAPFAKTAEPPKADEPR
jgi:hypothetical protein